MLRAGLRLASGPYALAVALRNRLYDRGWKESVRVSVPVLSVGNLTTGGTGKTPMVEYVARFCRQRDRRVAILSRGYGAAGAGPNDEALVLEENLPDVPHLQGPDRVALARAAVEELDSEVLVLDDGFQHRRLARDLDMVLIDATNPWGHGRLLPAGLLRESPRGLRRAGIALLTRCDQVDRARLHALRQEMARLAPGLPVAETVHRPAGLHAADGRTAPLEVLRERPVAAFCGLGNPDAFRRTLAALGADLTPDGSFRAYPDHHPYSREDVDDLRAWARARPADCVVVTTQKDLVKLRLSELAGRPLWALRVRLDVVAGRDRLDRQLEEAIRPPG